MKLYPRDIKLYEMAFCLVNYLNDELLHTDPINDGTTSKYTMIMCSIPNTASHYKKMYFDAKKQGNETREAKNRLNLKKS